MRIIIDITIWRKPWTQGIEKKNNIIKEFENEFNEKSLKKTAFWLEN